MLHRHSCSLYSSTYTLTHHSTLQAFWIQILIPQPKQTICTHLPLAHYWQVRVHTRQVMGQVTCWCWWGKASCLKNRTAFYSLALPGSLSGKLPCLKISESWWPNVACNLQQVTCSLALPLYWPRVNRPYVPQTCRTKETSINYIVASSWHSTLFHDEDARSNNPQMQDYNFNKYGEKIPSITVHTYETVQSY